MADSHRWRPQAGRGRQRWTGLLVVAALIGAGLTDSSQGSRGAAQEHTIALTSASGQVLLRRRSTLQADYPALAAWLETQANLAYCGVASSVVALNSLAVPAPQAEGYGRYRFWTQTNLFTPATLPFVKAHQVAREGMTLSQLQGLVQAVLPQRSPTQVRSGSARVARYHGLNLSLEQFRLLLRRNLANPADRLLVNYDRRLVDQQGGGHIAPVAAYEPHSDRVLILDVARYRYPAVWVETRKLWAATRSVDSASGLSRGLVWIEP